MMHSSLNAVLIKKGLHYRSGMSCKYLVIYVRNIYQGFIIIVIMKPFKCQ